MAIDGDFASVQAACVTNAQNGQVININAGEWTWTAGQFLAIKKAIQIIGNGVDITHATPLVANGATIINVATNNGLLFDCVFPDTDFLCRISGIVINATATGAGPMLRLLGKAYRHWNSGHTAVVGGLRIDHLRIRAAGGVDPYLILWGSHDGGGGYAGNYLTGSLDHNFINLPYTIDGAGNPSAAVIGAENTHYGNGGSPAGFSSIDGYGQYDWCADHTMGGGDDTELNTIYIEDNVWHRGGACVSTTGGGGRNVVRHNTFWGGVLGHGIESGGNMGPASWEVYNNHIINGGLGITSFAGENRRGGAMVSFNNRYTAYGGNNQPPPLRCQNSRPSNSNNAVFGPATGRNLFDQNEVGSISANGVNFNSTTCPGYSVNANPGIGTIYASGTATASTEVSSQSVFTLALDGTVSGQSNAGNLWKDFTLVNMTRVNSAGTGTSGEQLPMPLTGPQKASYALITSSSNNSTACQVNCQGGANTAQLPAQFHIAAGEQWAIFKVKSWFCNPGAGKVPVLLNGGANENNKPPGVGMAYQTSQGGTNKYWPTAGQPGWGLWQWNNLSRSSMTAGFIGVILDGGVNTNQAMGGIHNNQTNSSGFFGPSYRKNDKRGDFGGNPYPVLAGQTADECRIGADFEAPGLPVPHSIAKGTGAGQISGTGTNVAMGATYPNALVTPPSLAAPTMNATGSGSLPVGVAGTFQINATGQLPPTFQILSGSPGAWLTISSGGLLSISTASVVGVYNTIVIRATNASGHADQTFTLTISAVSNVPPTCQITAPAAPNLSFFPTDDVEIDVTATDSDGTIAQVQFLDGTTVLATLGPNPTAPYFLIQTFLPGTHSLKAIATDNAGAATTSATVAITVTNPTVLASPTIVVNAGTGANPITKQILLWQATTNNRISAVVTNRTYVDTLPFDGLVLSYPDYQDAVGPTSVVNYTTLTSQISPINGQLSNVTHNYLNLMPGNSGMQDPFDSWTQTIANFVTVARVCKEQGLTGIFLDNEEYNIHWWTYPTDVAHAGSHTLAAYQAEWRQRGKDVMAAMIAEWPAVKIVHTIGPNRSVTAPIITGGFNGDPNWLGGYFFMGMFEQAPGNQVIAGGEVYYLRTGQHFLSAKTFMDTIYTQNSALLSSSGLNTTWNSNDNLAWGIYDQDSGSPISSGAMTAAALQTTLQNSVPNCDEFVWNYSESGLEWLTSAGGTASNGWQDAVRAARATLGLPIL